MEFYYKIFFSKKILYDDDVIKNIYKKHNNINYIFIININRKQNNLYISSNIINKEYNNNKFIWRYILLFTNDYIYLYYIINNKYKRLMKYQIYDKKKWLLEKYIDKNNIKSIYNKISKYNIKFNKQDMIYDIDKDYTFDYFYENYYNNELFFYQLIFYIISEYIIKTNFYDCYLSYCEFYINHNISDIIYLYK
jgi:hypothetical protein